MNLFINGLYSSTQYFANTHTEWQSPVDSIRAKYQQSSIVSTLEALSILVGIPAESPVRKRAPSTPSSSLSSPVAKMAFPKSGNYPSSEKKKKKLYGKKLSYDVASISFTPETPLVDLIVPDY